MAKNLLLVEGNNDKFAISHLCRHHGILKIEPETELEKNILRLAIGEAVVTVRSPQESGASEDGEAQLLAMLENYLTKFNPDSSPQTIGVVIDVDANLQNRWKQICETLKKVEQPYNIPLQPAAEGTIISSVSKKTPRLGFWLMPNNQSIGKLEDFLYNLIPSDDPLNKAVEDSLQYIEKNQWQKYPQKDRIKAYIHTWLAWQKEPGTPIGQAIGRKYLTPNTPTAGQFAHWLINLFS